MAAEQGTHGWHCAAKCLDTLGRVRCIYYNEPSVYRGYPELMSISHGSGCIYTEQASLAPQATATRRSEAGPSVQRSSATALLQDSPDNGLRRAGPRPCVPGLEEGRHFQRPRAARPQSQRAPPGPLTVSLAPPRPSTWASAQRPSESCCPQSPSKPSYTLLSSPTCLMRGTV